MNSGKTYSGLRWDPYLIINGGELAKFWKHHFQEKTRDSLYVLGLGFDPRMCSGLEEVIKVGGNGKRDCLLINFDEGADSPSNQYQELVLKNYDKLKNLLNGRGQITEKKLSMWSDDTNQRRRIGPHSAAEVFTDVSSLKSYSDILIDVSALPRGLYFPLIAKALYLLDKNLAKMRLGKALPNLCIVVTENVQVDRKIHDSGIDDRASHVYGFGGQFDAVATAGFPNLWIPVLGEGQSAQLESIHALIIPDEIVPLLPSPSVDPRRGDDLILEYRELLLDRWTIEPKNIIYASEQNPFEVYRQIHRAVNRYNKALKPLGGCKVAISALSSKLLSIGALLAAYELHYAANVIVTLAHVETAGYEIDNTGNIEKYASEGVLFALYLSGESYDVN